MLISINVSNVDQCQYNFIMKNLFSSLYLALPSLLLSQVTFRVDSIPAYTPEADFIYIAGNFNGWQPGDVNYRLAEDENGKWWITMAAMAQGTQIQFKFTRGSWETVEKGPNGEELNNRLFTFGNGDTVGVKIYNWAQGGGGSTAAENVIVMDEAFEMPQLNRTRRIWLYLPPDYETSRYKLSGALHARRPEPFRCPDVFCRGMGGG